jgi:membrane protease YdiL (CAAX protease family)
MPAIADFAYAVLFAAGWPLYDYFVDWPTFQRWLRDDPNRARPRAYRNTALRQWILVAIGVALWQRAGRSWSALALESPSGWRLWTSAGVLLLIAGGYASQARAVARPGVKERLRTSLAALEAVVPHTRTELAWFVLASATAAVCEEFLFRGYLIWTLTPTLSWWGAAAASVPLFGFLHAYQGRKGVVRTAKAGVIMTLVVAGTRSLVPAMVLHAIIDIGGGVVTWMVWRDTPRHS